MPLDTFTESYPEVQTLSDAPKIMAFKSKEFLRIVAGHKDFQPIRDMLEKKHPEFDRHIAKWRTYGDISLNRLVSNADKARYLVKGQRESQDEFDARIKLSAFAPETVEILNDFVGAVFAVPATREIQVSGEDEKRLLSFFNASGIDGIPLEQLSQKACRLALTYNSVDALLDHPANEATETPYVTLYSPEDIYDWQKNERGRYVWVKYHEFYTVKPSWDTPIQEVDEYRIVDASGITTWKLIKVENQPDRIEGPAFAKHQFNDTPVRQLWWNQDGDAFVKPLVELDIKTFRIESDHTFDVHNTAHPTVLASLHAEEDAEGNKRTFERIERGAAKAIHIDPGSPDKAPEDVRYLETAGQDLQHQIEFAQLCREHARRLAGTWSNMEKNKLIEPESGVALAYQQSQRDKNYRTMAQNLAEWEWQLIELVISEGKGETELDRDDVLHLQYPSGFDMRNVAELNTDLQDAFSTGSDTLVKSVRKTMASKLMGASVTAEHRKAILEEIEAAPVQSPEDKEHEQAIELQDNKPSVGKGKPNG